MLGAGYVLAPSPLGRRLGVTAWLVVVTGMLVLVCGITETCYVDRCATRTHVRLLAGYDSGWVLATLASLAVA